MEVTPEEADKMQEWSGMDGAIAFHLIDRHADNWNEAGAMMDAWMRANTQKIGSWAGLDDEMKNCKCGSYAINENSHGRVEQ